MPNSLTSTHSLFDVQPRRLFHYRLNTPCISTREVKFIREAPAANVALRSKSNFGNRSPQPRLQRRGIQTRNTTRDTASTTRAHTKAKWCPSAPPVFGATLQYAVSCAPRRSRLALPQALESITRTESLCSRCCCQILRWFSHYSARSAAVAVATWALVLLVSFQITSSSSEAGLKCANYTRIVE